MLRRALPVVLAALVIAPAYAQTRATTPAKAGAQAAAQVYFPERLDWQKKKPEEVGMDPALIAEAVKLAFAAEAQSPKDGREFQANSFSKEPFNSIIGPVMDRGGAGGLIVHKGYIVAEWGDPNRADITNSVTKTFLTTTVGLAFQKGLIKDVNDFVRDYMPLDVDLSPPSTTARSSGITCCGRRATGRGRCGTSRTGRIGRSAPRSRSRRTGSCGSPARTSSTTTCA
jgi:hypothetical protein